MRIDCLGADDDLLRGRRAARGRGRRGEHRRRERAQPASELLRVLVGPWERGRAGPAARAIEDGPGDERRLRRLRAGADAATTSSSRSTRRRAGGVASGTAPAWSPRSARGEEQPTWVVTGTDEAGVDAAAELLDEESLRDRYAVASTARRAELPLPVSAELSDEDRARLRAAAAAASRRRSAAGRVAYLGSFAVVAFVFSARSCSPAPASAVAVAGVAAGRAARALRASLRWGLCSRSS